MNRTTLLAALAAGALLAPAAGAAAKKPESSGQGKTKIQAVSKAKGKSKAKKVKTVTYNLSGVYQGAGSVLVKKGNGAVKKAGLYGDTLTFDFESARLHVADADGNGVTLDDVKAGDRVVVHFKAPRKLEDGAALKAHKLVDQTRPKVEDESGDDDATTPEVQPLPLPIETPAP